MNGIKLLEYLSDLDEDLVYQAANPSLSRKKGWKRWAAAAACLCVIFAAAAGLWTQTDLFSTTKPETSPITGSQEEDSHPVLVYTPSPWPQQGTSGSISSEGESDNQQSSSSLPKPGEVLLSPEVTWTMQSYENTDSIFFLRLDFVPQGSSDRLPSDRPVVQQEVAKLRQQGYKVGYFSYYDSQEHQNTSQAAGYFTPEEIRSLSISHELGCLVSFSTDSVGYPLLPLEENFEEPCFGLRETP